MNNLSRAGKTIIVVFVTVALLGFTVKLLKKRPRIIYIQDPNYVQNIGEAQMRLKEQGLYHGKIDYIWGSGTDKAYCDWCAIRALEGE